MPDSVNKAGKKPRGFAAMSKEKQREIASKGGKASRGGGRKPKNDGLLGESRPKTLANPQ